MSEKDPYGVFPLDIFNNYKLVEKKEYGLRGYYIYSNTNFFC